MADFSQSEKKMFKKSVPFYISKIAKQFGRRLKSTLSNRPQRYIKKNETSVNRKTLKKNKTLKIKQKLTAWNFIEQEKLTVWNPIEQENHSIDEWLNMDETDNIIIRIEDKNYASKRSYFFRNKKNTYHECIYSKLNNKVFLPRKTIKQNKLLWMGQFGFPKYSIYFDNLSGVNSLKKTPNGSSRESSIENQKYYALTPTTQKNKIISRDTLILSQIGMSENNESNEINEEYDVFFDDKQINVLKLYTEDLYLSLNKYLYAKVNDSTKYSTEYLENAIQILDETFKKNAPIADNRNLVVYRGSSCEDIPVTENNQKDITIATYISTSLNVKTAGKFAQSTPNKNCLYELHLDENVPFIHITNSMVKNEKEILLPRNLRATYRETKQTKIKILGKNVVKDIYVFDLHMPPASISNTPPPNLCIETTVATIEPFNP